MYFGLLFSGKNGSSVLQQCSDRKPTGRLYPNVTRLFNRRAELSGFVRKSSKPAALARSLSSGNAFAVRAITGILNVFRNVSPGIVDIHLFDLSLT